ncbi:MAG TPA: hypothetical protein VLJ14_05265 [Ktedonobacterales bacterium]|nr:hypothetical protein [Ktedonobacterales bacterium]
MDVLTGRLARARADVTARLASMLGWWLGWWCGLTAPVPPPPYVAFAERDRARRARLVSLLLLGVVAWQLCVLVIGIFDPSYGGLVDTTMFAPQLLIFFCVVDVVVVALNRRGQVNQAGLALVAITESPLLALLAFPPHGRLGQAQFDVFYLLAISVLVAAALLPPWTVFAVAGLNALEVIGTVLVLPHNAALQQLLTRSDDTFATLVQPIALQMIVAVVAYLWVRGLLAALQRAERAEQIADTERAEALVRVRELESGMRRPLPLFALLADSTLIAARAPWMREVLLWQVGTALAALNGTTTPRAATEAEGEARTAAREQAEMERLTLELYRLGEGYPTGRAARVQLTEEDVRAMLRRVNARESDPRAERRGWPGR